MRGILVQNPRGVDVFDEMDRIMDSVFDNAHSFRRIGSLGTRNPAVDIIENDVEYRIEAELPGIPESRVAIKVENGVLNISNHGDEESGNDANGKADSEPKQRYLVRERRPSSVSRSFVLPKDVDVEKITAKFDDGVLTLTLPKAEKALPRKIEIKRV